MSNGTSSPKKQKHVQTGRSHQRSAMCWLLRRAGGHAEGRISAIRSGSATTAYTASFRERSARPHRESPADHVRRLSRHISARLNAAFGTDVDYATITKHYVGDSNLPDAAHRYSPGQVTGIEKDRDKRTPRPKITSARHTWSASIYRAGCRCAGLPASRNGFSQETRKPSRRNRALGLLLQSLPRPRNAALHARDGAWRDRSHLDDCGACTGCA